MSETVVTARVAAMRNQTGYSFWLETPTGPVPVSLPEGWTTDSEPTRMMGPNGEVRIQAGDLVRLPALNIASAESLEVLERRVSPRLGAARIPSMDLDGRDHTFVADVRRALRCWAAAPALPLLVALFAAAQALPAFEAPRPRGCGGPGTPCTSGGPIGYFVLTLLVVPVWIAALGYFGAQRVWYADLYAGRRPYLSWALGLSWRYVGRFLRLGLFMLIVLIPVSLVARAEDATAAAVTTVAVTVMLDIALTFVTPALAFTTPSAVQALSVGIRELRHGWPSDLPYLLIPPLAVSLTLRALPSATGATAGLFIQTGAGLFTSLFAGATAFRYLRQTQAVPTVPGEPRT